MTLYDFFCLRLKYQRIKQASLTPPVVSRHNNVKRAPSFFHFFFQRIIVRMNTFQSQKAYIPSSATSKQTPSFMTRAAISWKKATQYQCRQVYFCCSTASVKSISRKFFLKLISRKKHWIGTKLFCIIPLDSWISLLVGKKRGRISKSFQSFYNRLTVSQYHFDEILRVQMIKSDPILFH